MKFKIIDVTPTHIKVDVTPLFKGKKKIPKFISFDLKDVEVIYK